MTIPYEEISEVRQPHFLESNKRCSIPHHLVFVDTESNKVVNPTDPTKYALRFRLGCAAYCRLESGRVTRPAEYTFHESRLFWEWIKDYLHPKQSTWLVAHNLGFDLTQLGFWSRLESGEYRLADSEWQNPLLARAHGKKGRGWHGLLCVSDPPTIIQARAGNCTLTCVDSINYCPVALSVLGESVGQPKLAMPGWDAPDADWETYCRQDVAVLRAWFTRLLLWWQREDLGEFRFTASGLAMSAYRHRFMAQPQRTENGIPCEKQAVACPGNTGRIFVHGHRRALELERAAYWGGEVRCFRHGPVEGPIFVYDVNSLYPFIMSIEDMPYRLLVYGVGATDLMDILRRDKEVIIAHVLIASDTLCYPVSSQGRTVYARGRFWTHLAGCELEEAARHGHVQDWQGYTIYDKSNLFAPYVDYFYALKAKAEKDGDLAGRLFAKMLLNNLHGKLGQHQIQWQDASEEIAHRKWGEWYRGHDARGCPQLWRAVAFHTQKFVKGGETNDSCPSISACITAAAREWMRRLRSIAGEKEVYYQDTDCIHVSDAGRKNLVASADCIHDGLGGLRLVGEYESATYYGLKHYLLGDKLTCSALKKSAVPVAAGVYRQEDWQRLPSILATRPRDQVNVSERIIVLKESHVDGTARPDGSVEPITIYEV